MSKSLYELFFLSLVCGSISMTISRSKFFASTRDTISRYSGWLYRLITCPYCTSHWIALGLVILYRPHWFACDVALNYFFCMMALITGTAMAAGTIFRNYAVMPPPSDKSIV